MERAPPPEEWRPPSIDFVVSALPPLPPISDSQLALQARTTKSSVQRDGLAQRAPRDAELMSNEVLEWGGDAVLLWLITKRLRNAFPRGTVAELNDLRARLTSNRTFSHLAWHLGLTRELIHRQRERKQKSQREDDQRLSANAFEAYCGAVVEANGGDEAVLYRFVERLLTPAVFPSFDHVSKSMQSDPEGTENRRPRLETGDPVKDAEHRMNAGRRAVIECRNHTWIDEFVPGLRWKATLQVGGQIVGSGNGGKIAGAREVALDEYLDQILVRLESSSPGTVHQLDTLTTGPIIARLYAATSDAAIPNPTSIKRLWRAGEGDAPRKGTIRFERASSIVPLTAGSL